jgi:opine dehydrogenase
MMEDVRFGSSFLVTAGKRAGIATPLSSAFVALGSAICSEDFLQTGRTLDGLGLGALSAAELKTLLTEGLR